jgi:hypothetical protein
MHHEHYRVQIILSLYFILLLGINGLDDGGSIPGRGSEFFSLLPHPEEP